MGKRARQTPRRCCSSTTTTALQQSSMASPSFEERNVDTKLPGIYKKSAKSRYFYDLDWLFAGGIWKRILGALRFFFRGGLWDMICSLGQTYGRSIPVTIYDGRAKQRDSGLSDREFFEKYGFVLLSHKSAMKTDDWIESDQDVGQLTTAMFRGGEELQK